MSQGEKQAGTKPVLGYLNLSSRYERKARLLPGLLCMSTLAPAVAAFGAPIGGWVGLTTAGVGLWAGCGVGLSHLASAAGNRYQERLWPRWPHDSPTNRWLRPKDRTASIQQKKQVYGAIRRLTGLDVEVATEHGPREVDAVVNDCIARLRHRLRNAPHADRLDAHNADYGYARNFAGLRPLWLSLLASSAVGCWVGYARFGRSSVWCWVASGLLLLGILLTRVLEQYVRVRARHYAESFFSAVLELDAEERKSEATAVGVTK